MFVGEILFGKKTARFSNPASLVIASVGPRVQDEGPDPIQHMDVDPKIVG